MQYYADLIRDKIYKKGCHSLMEVTTFIDQFIFVKYHTNIELFITFTKSFIS